MMARIGGALKEIAAALPPTFPVHPRTRGNLEKFGIDPGSNITLVGPQAYMAFLNLWKDAAVVTYPVPPPSRGRLGGGWGRKLRNIPPSPLRPPNRKRRFRDPPLEGEGEMRCRTEVSAYGQSGEARIVAEARKLLRGAGRQGRRPHLWDGKAAQRIVAVLAGELARK